MTTGLISIEHFVEIECSNACLCSPPTLIVVTTRSVRFTRPTLFARTSNVICTSLEIGKREGRSVLFRATDKRAIYLERTL